MTTGTIHTCALVCNVKTVYEDVIASDDLVRAICQFSNKTDLLGASYTTFWRNLLRPFSLLPLGGSRCLKHDGTQVPEHMASHP